MASKLNISVQELVKTVMDYREEMNKVTYISLPDYSNDESRAWYYQ